MTAPTEREVLVALFTKLHDGKSAQWLDYYGEAELSAKGRRFNALMGLNAYLDAAMMLVPEGHQLGIMQEHPDQWRAGMGSWGFDRADHTGEGSTPALALCAAIDAARDAAP